ncbi:golgin subfamily A member 3-like isoform X2 [Petaurus breviceps papuanus]|uniref:golgin subfamily A member 3-like isoform X2 n=1 Tax=Petaurus breviceps papuanus TaxID=3040969 RepID=UPI0036DB7F7C
MKQLTLIQETLHTQEQALRELETRHEELQARLEELQGYAATKDITLQVRQKKKNVLEVVLQVALESKEEWDRGPLQLQVDADATLVLLEQLRPERIPINRKG